MKWATYIMFFFGCTTSAFTQEIQWLEGTEINLGLLSIQQDTTFHYTFKNNTGKPVIIETVRTSCGCTDPQWPSGAIAPGEPGQIQVTFTPKRAGFHRKKIKVFLIGIRKGQTLWLEAEAR